MGFKNLEFFNEYKTTEKDANMFIKQKLQMTM